MISDNFLMILDILEKFQSTVQDIRLTLGIQQKL